MAHPCLQTDGLVPALYLTNKFDCYYSNHTKKESDNFTYDSFHCVLTNSVTYPFVC